MPEEISNIKFSGITDDSRTVKKGDIFFAVKGTRCNGIEFRDEAIKKGAAGVIECSRKDLARFASDFYGAPSKKVKVIGITGTNGKTTISYLLEHIFRTAGYKSGVIGTIAHKWGSNVIEAKNTTPGAIELQRILCEMAKDGVKYCAMEVSSHSLDQDRVLGIDFKAAVFTNLTGEHLDYHKTLENYLQAKAKLFSALKPARTAILNLDDENAKRIAKATSAKILTYGINSKADICADEIKFGLEGSEFVIRIKKGKEGNIRRDKSLFKVTSPLVGNYNVYNILAAAAVALNERIKPDIIRRAVLEFRGAEGRLEAVPADRGIKIFVDYAHTDNALENVLTALKPLAKKRIITVFGCGGDRDKFKRPRMGKVASRLSDYVVITSDNPRSEEPSLIAREIERGIEKGFRSYEVILDRFEAIRSAIAKAQAGDIILIAGKGHEKYQIVGDKILPFSDKEAVETILVGANLCVRPNNNGPTHRSAPTTMGNKECFI